MLLTHEEKQRLEQKIAALECLTSAEFKIIITPHAYWGLKRKAARLFKKYQLHKTKDRSAVLVLLVAKDRQFLIYGDEGIHQKVGNSCWHTISQAALAFFKQEKYEAGLATTLHLLADILTEHFPSTGEKANEITNEIIIEK